MTTVAHIVSLGISTLEQAEPCIAAALAEARALRAFDDQLFPHDDECLPKAREIHGLWKQWLEDADSLYQQVRGQFKNRHLNGLADLEYAIGRTSAMLQIEPYSHMQCVRDSQAGKTTRITMEEMRRELRDRARREAENQTRESSGPPSGSAVGQD